MLSFQCTRRALFPGDSEIDQIYRIFRFLGTPTDNLWEGVSRLPDYKANFPKWEPQNIKESIPVTNEEENFLKVQSGTFFDNNSVFSCFSCF